MVSLTIDGQRIEVEEGATVLEAANELGINIPTLCYHKALTPYGACRLCVVEIENRGRMDVQASCQYKVMDGITVKTNTERIIKTRRIMAELLLARAPNSEKVREVAKQLGVAETRIEKKYEDCILCGLCVRMCHERMGVGAIEFVNRGYDRKVKPPFETYSEICRTCGGCVFICPTDAMKFEDITRNKPLPIPSEFDMGLRSRSAIDIPFPQAVPNKASIDRDYCVHFLKDACGVCREFCEADAINYEQTEEKLEIKAGSVILTSGYDVFDASNKGEYGYSAYKNVITSLEFERILSASGPFQGHVLRPSDHKEPKRMAWIQCVGSRDISIENDYCSSVCCMYAIKEAIMAVDHVPGLEPTIFYNDIRAYGKGFEQYYEASKSNYGVRFVRGIISTIKERQKSNNLFLRYITEEGEELGEEFDLVVLSVGLCSGENVKKLADTFDINLNRFGFAESGPTSPAGTNREGIYVAGAFDAPMDIPETVMTASTASAFAGELLAEVRGTMIHEKTYPPERDVTGEEPRTGVFVCRCGTNIARAVDVPAVVEYAGTLPNVVHSEENLYTCSTDNQKKITDVIKEHNLNRLVVASCSPRTHEPLFQDSLREAGLNKYLFDMANIRDQCSWVHYNQPDLATYKAQDLVRMAVARVTTLQPLKETRFDVVQKAVVVGGGIAGMVSALSVADQGYECILIEREKELGGMMRRIKTLRDGTPAEDFLKAQIERVKAHPGIEVLTESEITDFTGHVGNFKTTVNPVRDNPPKADALSSEGISNGVKVHGETRVIAHGATIVATGGVEYRPREYGYTDSEQIITQLELEKKLADEPDSLKTMKDLVMIQCVGSRQEDHLYCSRICCSQAVRNALKLKEINPNIRVYVLFRDIRTYGFNELDYQKAREAGVIFIRFDPDNKPTVIVEDGIDAGSVPRTDHSAIKVKLRDDVLGKDLMLTPDIVVLSAGVRPHPESSAISKTMKIPLNADGFFLEAHMKLRPLDFSSEGVFLAGLAHAPKNISECISQAKGAAARAVTVISRSGMFVPGSISVVDEECCAACLTCVRLCPYDVPEINERGVAYIEAAACQGCGVCASACPRKAIITRHYGDEQILSKAKTLFGDEKFEKEKGLKNKEENKAA